MQMCGIVGYIGNKNVVPILMAGLKRLEYRGYDSAGIAVLENDQVRVAKQAGKLAALEAELNKLTFKSTIGIGHTRWATHGEPNKTNAHPHIDTTGNIALIHNGIIENYATIRKMLENKGHTFRSETDTEVICHLLEEMYKGDFESAFQNTLDELEGTYGLAVVTRYEPDKIFVARQGSPLVVGLGDGEFFLASDVSAIVAHTRSVFYLEDGETAVLDRDGITTKTRTHEIVDKEVEQVAYDIEQIEKGGYPHYMLKEIFEQTKTIEDAFRGRLISSEGKVKLGGLAEVEEKLINAERIILIACGTSWHSALIGEYLIEEYCRIPVEVEYASEFRYRNPIIGKNDIIFAISQSGETADTLAAIKEGKHRGATTLGIVNSVGSTIARETEAGVYLHAGPEIGVASTKAFTSQVTVLIQIMLLIARKKNLSLIAGQQIIDELTRLPGMVKKILSQAQQIEDIAEQYKDKRNFLYLGRGINFPVALEGALKLKEISYIHAEGYPAAEMKHGPIALIDNEMPVVFIATNDLIYDKVISNLEEVRARKGRVIVIANEGDKRIADLADHVIYIPRVHPAMGPLLTVIPLQLLAYYIAVKRGCDVDQPRNLAKSVTVE
jgi:glucosamine--fructose-6-phosphate aminotransferase (isomerizing)